jgi:hypothetical protein
MSSPPIHSPTSPDADAKSSTERSTRAGAWPAWLVFSLIVLIRIPFLILHPLQEDAFIVFRSARHLAEFGDFSFNFHQHFPGTTSLLYPLIVAAIDLLSRSHMMLIVQLFGTLCIAGACWFIAHALTRHLAEQRIVWLLTACWPIALLMSYTGLETALLTLVLGASTFALARENHTPLFWVSLLLLPLIRPDAVSYGLLFCAAMFVIDRRTALRGALALSFGCGLLLLGTRLTTGHFLSTTARAKEIAYHPGHSIADIAGRTYDLYLNHSFLLPTPSNYLLKLSPFVLILVVSAFVLAFRFAGSRRELVVLSMLATASIVIPFAYACGGVIFAWYLYPANLLAIAVTIAVAVKLVMRLRFRFIGATLLTVLWIGLMCLQWSKALDAATEEYHYRADIGRYLGEVSHGRGTLFLEPAGLIPYYSGLRTDDEIGLVSTRVTDFIKRDPVEWWFDYVAAERPDYIVQRQIFDHYRTFEGYTLTPDQQRWFNAHYQLIRRFHYISAAYHPSPFLQRILAMSPMEDYLIYQRTDHPKQ